MMDIYVIDEATNVHSRKLICKNVLLHLVFQAFYIHYIYTFDLIFDIVQNTIISNDDWTCKAKVYSI